MAEVREPPASEAEFRAALRKELSRVWDRRVREIDGGGTPVSPLPCLEGLRAATSSIDPSLPRTAAIRQMLLAATHYVKPDAVAPRDRSNKEPIGVTLRTIFGLDPSLANHERHELWDKATESIYHLRRRSWEDAKTRSDRNSRWRGRVFEVFADGVIRASEHGFEVSLQSEESFGTHNDLTALPRFVVGRDEVMKRMMTSSASTILVTGEPGVGKTTLAVEVADRLASDDHALVIDLSGYGEGVALGAADAIQLVLDRLGHAATTSSLTSAERISAYRAVLARQRIVVVFDNVGDGTVARDLLPGSRAKSQVILTSRNSLPSLRAVSGVQIEDIDILSATEAVELLRAFVGRRRSESEPDALAALARLCGYLPFALTVLGSILDARPRKRLSTTLRELSGSDAASILNLTTPDTNTSARTILDWSFSRLDPNFMKVAISLAWMPVVSANVEMVKALQLPAWQRALDILTAEHLLFEDEMERFSFHSLTREYLLNLSGTLATASRPYLKGLLDAAVKGIFASVSTYEDELQFHRPSSIETESNRGELDDEAVALDEEAIIIPQWTFQALADLQNLHHVYVVWLRSGSAINVQQMVKFWRSFLGRLGLWEWEATFLREALTAINANIFQMVSDEQLAELKLEVDRTVEELRQSVLVFTVRTGWTERAYPLLRSIAALSAVPGNITDEAFKTELEVIEQDMFAEPQSVEDFVREVTGAVHSHSSSETPVGSGTDPDYATKLNELHARQALLRDPTPNNAEPEKLLMKAAQQLPSIIYGPWNPVELVVRLGFREIERGDLKGGVRTLRHAGQLFLVRGSIGHARGMFNLANRLSAESSHDDSTTSA
ncbi:MAG TPA: NB-ARC domain-containing protein [Galbitalea sp.]|nr:NB-ARC domain-containing protein [Galbitalea sp.]